MNKVLMYHAIGKNKISETGAELYSVPVDTFNEQVKLLKEKDTITFDDGLEDNFTNAYPILKKLGLKAYFFVMPDKVGTKGYMGWEQLKELQNNGMIIGSHGMTHRILTGLNDTELNYELKESKRLLEEKLNTSIKYFSVPRGFYNNKVIAKLKEAGYKTVFTSDYNDNDGFKVGRIAVKNSWSLEYFKRVLKNGLSFKDKTKELAKTSTKRLLGAKLYDKIRAGLINRNN